MPENALAVLEAIKLYLDYAKCVFFIGVDKRVIEQGVRERYPESLKITGKDYIEKMIQVDFYLPSKSSTDFQQLLIGFMDRAWDTDIRMWKMLTQATGCNVRKAKRFVNSFNLIERIIGEPEREKSKNYFLQLARVLLIQMNFPDFFEFLQKMWITPKNDDNSDLLETILNNLEQKEGSFLINEELSNFIKESSEQAKISNGEELNSILQLLRQTGGKSA